MAAISYLTSRGAACKLTAAEIGGWRDPAGNVIAAYPAHGNWYYVLLANVTGFANLRDVNRTDDAGVVLTPQTFGYAPLVKPRNSTNFVVTQDDIARQGLCACPSATWTASGGTIQARYMAKCDQNPFSTPGNIVDLFDLGGLSSATSGQTFVIPNIATYVKA